MIRDFFFGVDGATASRASATKCSIDDSMGAAHTGPNSECLGSTILLAGTAFDAGIKVCNGYLAVVAGQHRARTHLQTHATPDAPGRVQLEGDYVLEIKQIPHRSASLCHEH